MALFYVNPCSIGMGKKRKKEEKRRRRKIKGNKKRRKKKGKKIVDFSLFFLGFFYIWVFKKNREGNNQCCPVLDLKRNLWFGVCLIDPHF
jgi:hypothetical protein